MQDIIVGDATIKLYYEEFLEGDETLSHQAQAKHLLLFDLALCPNFLKEIQIYYDMNSEPKMLMKKL